MGVGLPIAAVGIMAQFIDPRLAMSLMVFPIMFSNIWQVHSGGNIINVVKKYWLFAIVLSLALITTTFFTVRISTNWLVAFVGIVVILFSLMNLVFNPPPLPARFHRLGQIIGGCCAGVMGGLTAIWSPPIAAYLISTDASKNEFVTASGFLFIIGSIPLCIGFWHNGLLTGPIAGYSAAMIVPTLIGFYFGEAIRKRLKPERFKSVVLICFLFIGLNLIRKSIVG